MLLSIQQKYILEVLRKLRVLRREQLAALVRGKFQRPGFEITDARMEAMLRQLRSGMGDVCLDGQFVLLSGASPNSLLLEALAFPGGTISACLPWRSYPPRSDP